MRDLEIWQVEHEIAVHEHIEVERPLAPGDAPDARTACVSIDWSKSNIWMGFERRFDAPP